jgi:enterochelin esterase-like enzyme
MLLAWWFLALLISAAAGFPLAALGFGIRRHRRRRAGRPIMSGWRLVTRRVTLVLGTVAFTLAAIAAGVNDHYSYIPSFHALFGDVSPDLVSHPVAARAELARRAQHEGGDGGVVPAAVKIPDHGTVEKVSIDGPVSGVGGRDAYVYLPTEYFDPARSAQHFPVLYLLHGSPGVAVDWLRAGWADRAMDDLLAKHRVAPFIMVMPDVNGGYRRDSECEDILPNGPKTQTYLVRDVVDYVDANYRTVPQRGARVVGGLSTGGYCAVNLTLRHQDVFSGIVSHSGYDRPDHNLYTGDLFAGDRKEAEANTPGLYLPTIPLTNPLGVYLDVGMGDNGSRVESMDMARVFEKRGVTVAFHDFADESHSWNAWRRNLYSSLPWVSSWFVTTGVATEPAAGGGPAVVAAPPAPAPAAPPAFAAEPAPTDDDNAPPDAMHAAPAPQSPPGPEPAKPDASATAAAAPNGGPPGERHPAAATPAHPRHRGPATGNHHHGNGITVAADPGGGPGAKPAVAPKPEGASPRSEGASTKPPEASTKGR